MTIRSLRLRRAAALAAAVVGGAVFWTACSKRGPRDVGNQNPRSGFADGPAPRLDAGAGVGEAGGRIPATPSLGGVKARELAKASSRAIAIDGSRVYFGDAEDDGLYAVAKTGGQPAKLARRAPMPAALSVDGTTLAWIGTPGDAVLRIATGGGPVTTVRDRGLFTGVVASGSDVFVVEAEGTEGVLTRASSGTSRVATFDGSPRSAVADLEHVYVATSTHLVAAPRVRGETAMLASGTSFSHPAIDDTYVYATVTTEQGRARSVVRVKKAGGPLETVATGVRDAPIAVYQGSVYWFDAERPALLAAVPSSAASPRTISEDAILAQPAALAIDGDGVFLAAGFAEEGRILVIPRSPSPSAPDGGAR